MPVEWSSLTPGIAGQSPAQSSPAPAQTAQDVGAQVRAQVQQALAEAAQARAEAQTEAQQALREAAQARQEAEAARREAIRDAQRAVRDAQRQAGRAGQPGIFVSQFPPMGPQIPEGAVIMTIAFFVMCAVIAIGVPIARAIARRMDRKSLGTPAPDVETRARLERIEHAVDAIAVEVERISEGQRFTTKVLADLRAIPDADAAGARRLGNA